MIKAYSIDIAIHCRWLSLELVLAMAFYILLILRPGHSGTSIDCHSNGLSDAPWTTNGPSFIGDAYGRPFAKCIGMKAKGCGMSKVASARVPDVTICPRQYHELAAVGEEKRLLLCEEADEGKRVFVTIYSSKDLATVKADVPTRRLNKLYKSTEYQDWLKADKAYQDWLKAVKAYQDWLKAEKEYQEWLEAPESKKSSKKPATAGPLDPLVSKLAKTTVAKPPPKPKLDPLPQTVDWAALTEFLKDGFTKSEQGKDCPAT